MGFLTSYCKDCNSEILWVGTIDLFTCGVCGKIIPVEELTKSLFNKEYWIIEKRKKKLNKIRKNIRKS